jgi:hypothetical protein
MIRVTMLEGPVEIDIGIAAGPVRLSIKEATELRNGLTAVLRSPKSKTAYRYLKEGDLWPASYEWRTKRAHASTGRHSAWALVPNNFVNRHLPMTSSQAQIYEVRTKEMLATAHTEEMLATAHTKETKCYLK